MRLLLEKIRKILRDRRARQMLTRIVSSLAAVVVFVTTYALVLPAITMESQAACGIPAHQHDDSCYEEVLVCGLPEGDGHTHTDACYTVVSELACGLQEHQHADGCYDADGNLICGISEHIHGESCYEETRTLTCGLEESKGHHHDASCYEKQLKCGMEAHTHSAACYSHVSGNGTAGSSAKDYAVVVATTEAADGAASGAGNTGTNTDRTTDAAVEAGTDFSALPAAEDAYVPELEALFFDRLLTKKTGIYYFHPEEGKTIPENSADITDWTRVDDDTDLDPNDILRVYLRYTIPAGSLNSTNPVARYRLPANLHLTDQQMEEINTNVNGISNQYVNLDTLEILDPDQYNQYLGIEAVEGTRTPAEDINEYFGKHPDMNGQEYINATVQAENVYDTEGLYGKKDAYLGQDLIFTFTPYTIQKNQNEYDSDGQPTKAGEKVQGWLCLDVKMDQVDWGEAVVTTEKGDAGKTSETDVNVDETAEPASAHEAFIEQKESNAEIIFATEDKALKIDEISTNLRKIERTETTSDEDAEKSNQASPDEKSREEGADETDDAAAVTDSATEINAETYPAASFEDSIVVHAGTLSTDNGSAAKDTPEETTIAVSVTADAETFPRGTTMVLGTVDDMDTVASAVEGAVEGRTRGFHAVDISFIDPDGNEIEPLKPIKVSMTSEAIKQAVEDSSTVPIVVHVENPAESAAADSTTAYSVTADSASEVSAETDSASQKADSAAEVDNSASAPTATIVESNETISTDKSAEKKETADTLSFDAGSFSVYAIVYTVDFHYEINGKMYEFGIPGGGFVSLEHIVEVLGIARIGENTVDSGENEANEGENALENGIYNKVEETGVETIDENTGGSYEESISLNNVEVSEATKQFVADVASVEFSSPELVWVGKVDETSTVGGLKEANGLEVQYSAELTEEQIAEINSSTVEAGDWALVSVLPFTSEESLTVTMKNGEVFTVKVTDAQIALFGDLVESTSYMKIRVHSSVPMVKALKKAGAALYEDRDVVEAYEAVPHSPLIQITVDIASLPESNPGETFELCVVKDGSVSSLGEADSDSVFTFRADEADAFALVKSKTSSHTLTGAYGVTLSGNFPEGAHAVVTEAEPVEMDGILPERSFAYDIKVYDSNEQEWQPAAGETVECFVPYEGTQEELEEYYWVVLHTSGGVTEQLYDAAPVDGGIRFTTGSFSTFTLRAQVTGTSYIGYSNVHFVDHQGNEINGAVSGTIDYAYRVPYDMWAYADRLEPSIAGDYEFSRVYLQLSGMQKDFRYIYLGTRREVDGGNVSGYRIYMFMNSLEEAKTINGVKGTYSGTWYTFSSGTQWSNDIYIVFNHVEDVSFKKVDSEGEPVAGAGFTLYTDESCINVLTYNGSTVTATSDANGKVDFGRIPYGTYYMKETTTPSEFKETGKVYTVNVNGNTSIDNIVNENDDGSIIVKETKSVNIKKEWSDGEDHSNDSVTIKLFDQSTEAGSVTLNAGNNWSQSITNLDPTVSYMISETNVTSSGEDVTNGWIPEISEKTTGISTSYYQSDGFQEGEQYVIVYNRNTALTNSNDSLSTTSVTVQNNMLTSSVNNNMLWTVENVSDDGVISLKNAGNSRYLNLNNPSSGSRSWGMTTAEPQFVRYKPNNGTVQIFYRENMNAATAYYMNGTGVSTGSGTNFTLYKKVNVRTENVTVTNKPAEYPVMIRKLEYSSDTAIQGTTFNLYTEEEYNDSNPGTPVYTGLTSGADGCLTADVETHIELFAGTYYLVETQEADGYVKLSEPVKFTISRGGRFTARSADQEFTDYTYASAITEGETSYPLLKVPNQKKVILTFKAEEGVDKVQLVSGKYIDMSGNGTKELTVVIPEVTGSPIKVAGIAEDGKVINGWTINDETAKLTTEKTISTAINDDANTSGTWTERTYHVWTETEKKVNVTKEVKEVGTASPDDIDTTAYFVLWDHAANRNVLDEDGNVLIKSISIVDGVPQGTVTFDGLKSGTYSVWEVDANGRDLAAGTVVIGDDIAVSKIETRHGSDAGNRATVDENITTDGITVINTYNHKSDVVDWTINKEWYMEKNTVNQSDKVSTATSAYPIPNDASSTLVLYRKDDLNTPIQTIVLDGTVDTDGEAAAWKATFTDIPIKDSDGKTIEYVVKEIAFTPEKSNEGLYIYPYTAETDHDGGTIRNAVIYGNIRIFKQFEIQPHVDISQIVGDLEIKVTGPHGFSKTYTFPAENNYNPSLVTEDLPAGIYHVEEVNYVDLIPNRKWNPTASYIFASSMPPEQSDQQGKNQAGETETDVLIGTNGRDDDTVEVRIKNDYLKLDIKATKVWADSSETHPAIELTLYRVDGDGNKTPVGEKKTIPANATGEDLTVVWEQMDQQYTYIVEETPVYGYTAQVTGDALNGFTVTNTPKEQVRLTVVKKVEGTEKANQKTYKVKVIPDGFPDQTQILELKPVNGEDSKTIEVPYGTYTVEELLSDAEDSSYTIDIDDYDRTTTIAIGSGNGEEGVSKTVILQKEAETGTVTVTNSYKRKTTDVSFIKLDGKDHSKALSADFQIEYSVDNKSYATINDGEVSGVTNSVFTVSQTGISLPLKDGFYRLTERTAPDGYHLMSGTVVFSVADGVISLLNASECKDYATELKQDAEEESQAASKTIGLTLYNYEKVPVSIWKTGLDKKAITTGASFVLYRADNYNDETQHPIEEDKIVTSGTTGKNGILSLGELELGEYRLVETKAPDGYLKAEHAIKIFVSISGISVMQETGYSDVNYQGDDDWVADQEEKTAQIRVWNNLGYELPATGGPGTTLLYLLGLMLTTLAGAGLMMKSSRTKNAA